MKDQTSNGKTPNASSPFGPANGWTAPSSIPRDVAKKILAARDAINKGEQGEAYHQLYSIADPTFSSYEPWKALEAQSNDQAHPTAAEGEVERKKDSRI